MAEFMVAYQVYDILVLVDPACGGCVRRKGTQMQDTGLSNVPRPTLPSPLARSPERPCLSTTS